MQLDKLKSLLSTDDCEALTHIHPMFNEEETLQLLRKWKDVLNAADASTNESFRIFAAYLLENWHNEIELYGNNGDSDDKNTIESQIKILTNLNIWRIVGTQPLATHVGCSLYANAYKREFDRQVIAAQTDKLPVSIEAESTIDDMAKKTAEDIDNYFFTEIIAKTQNVNSFVNLDVANIDALAKTIEYEATRSAMRTNAMPFNIAIAHESIIEQVKPIIAKISTFYPDIYPTTAPVMKNTVIFAYKPDDFNCGMIWSPYLINFMRYAKVKDFTPVDIENAKTSPVCISARIRHAWKFYYPEDYFFTLKFN